MKRHARPNKKTWKEDERRIRRYIIPALGQLALEKVGKPDPAKIPKKQRFKEKVRDRPLTSAELPRLLAVIETEADSLVRGAVLLYLLTGLRKREILKARWEDFDFERGTLRLVDTKAGRPRHVPLSQSAMTVVKALPRTLRKPYVFASPVKKGAHRLDIFKPWRRMRREAGCADSRIHNLLLATPRN